MQSVYNVFGIFFNDSAYIYIKGTTTGKHFFFFGNPAVCEIDPQEVNLTLSVPDGSSNPRNSRVTEKNLLINGNINVCK